MQGVMKLDLSLLGTGLHLFAGQVVDLTEATNLPRTPKPRWFARPADGQWSDGIDHDPDDSILIDDDDVIITAVDD